MSAEDANARYLPQASRRVIELCEMSEDASAPSGWAEAAVLTHATYNLNLCLSGTF